MSSGIVILYSGLSFSCSFPFPISFSFLFLFSSSFCNSCFFFLSFSCFGITFLVTLRFDFFTICSFSSPFLFSTLNLHLLSISRTCSNSNSSPTSDIDSSLSSSSSSFSDESVEFSFLASLSCFSCCCDFIDAGCLMTFVIFSGV